MRILSLTLGSLAALGAQEWESTLIVTADRQLGEAWRSTASTTTISAEDIAALGSPPTWSAPLAMAPGIDLFSSAGGLDGGGLPTLRLRGTASNADTGILVDGIPWTDASNIGTDPILLGIDLPVTNRMEVVRGPQSGLYGARAIGGVVNILTARPTATHQVEGMLEAGNFATHRVRVQGTGPLLERDGRQILGYVIAASGVESDGVSVSVSGRNADPSDAEADGFWRTGLSTRMEYAPQAGATLYAAGWIGRGYHAFDYSDPEDDQAFTRNDQMRASAGGSVALGDGGVVNVDVARTRSERDSHDGFNGTSHFVSIVDYVSGRVLVPLAEGMRIQLGGDLDQQAASYTEIGTQSQNDLGVWAQMLTGDEEWEASVVLRYDDLSVGDDALTWKVGAAWFACEQTLKLHGTCGTAYRVASLDDRYASYFFAGFPPFFPDYSYAGNPDLEPQRSLGWDVGVGAILDGGWEGDVTAFGTHYENRSAYTENTDNPALTTATLVNESSDSQVIGIESSFAWRPGDPWWSQLSATWQQSEDENGDAFINLPETKASWLAGWQAEQWWTTATLHLVSMRRARNDEDLPGYATVDLAAGWDPRPWLGVVARIENLFDRRTVQGVTFTPDEYYAGAPRTVSLGIEARY